MNNIPPLPDGFTLDEEVPPLPEGFTLDAPQEKPEGSVVDAISDTVKGVGGGMLGGILGSASNSWDFSPGMYVYRAITGEDAPTVEDADKNMQEIQEYFRNDPDTKRGEAALGYINKLFSDFDRGIKPLTAGVTGVLAGMTNALDPTTPFKPIDTAIKMNQRVKDSSVGQVLREDTLATTGSDFLAKTAESLPAVAEVMMGSKIGSKIDGPQSKVEKPPLSDGQKLVKEGERLNVGVLTTDVSPPQGFMGKSIQRISEKLGPLGSGNIRQAQQAARQDVVENLATEFNVSMDSPFFEQIIDSMTTKNARILEVANGRRRKAIDSLKINGDVTTTKTLEAVDNQLSKQSRLKGAAKQDVIAKIDSYGDAVQGQNFEALAAVRTELIREIKDLEGSTTESKTSKIQALSEIKKAIDIDMLEFANKTDKNAAKQWTESNRALAEQLTNVKQSELKRLIEKGEVKPELVSTILRGGKRSELIRLKNSLSPNGRKSARAAIVKDALDRSGFFRSDPNPNKFATELGKTNTKQAIDILFNETDKKQLLGLQRLLDATRRAQDASLTLETGASLVPWAGGGAVALGAQISPFMTGSAVASLSVIAKAYESAAFRDLLLRVQSTQKGSKQERKVLSAAIPSLLVALQGAKEEPQQKQ